MTLREALDTKPQGLTNEHETVARILIGRPEGVQRPQAEYLSGMPDRKFRRLCREIATAGWLPTVSAHEDDGTRVYKIAKADEHHLVNTNNNEDRSRAVKLHECARGRARAFERMHQAGSLFLEPVEPLEAV